MAEKTNLEKLCDLAGIVRSFRDAWRNERHLPEASQRGLLASMGVPAATDDEVAASIQSIEAAPWRQPLAPVLVVAGASRGGIDVPLTLPAADADRTIEWRLDLELGEARSGKSRFADLPLLAEKTLDGAAMECRAIRLAPPVADGYHALRLYLAPSAGAAESSRELLMPIIVAPPRAHVARARRGQGRLWGIGTQLYGLRSNRNWGMGDFTDLALFAEAAGRLGAAAVGINPLHALFPGNPQRISPYSPSDRRFVCLLYLDVEAIPDLAHCEAARSRLHEPAFQQALKAAQATALVDYAAVAAAKREILERVYECFRGRHLGAEAKASLSERGAAFRRFQATGGLVLERFATFQALSEHFGADKHWAIWPAEFRDCDSAAVADFAAKNRDRVEFFQYVQWQADEQLGTVARAARRAHMAIGLYHDLALSADRDGAEAWTNQHHLAWDVRIGSPPDEWNHRGQDWGLIPYNPAALKASGYAPFIALLRANMAHAGALRIDHAMWLARMYWIPAGATPQDGGYVSYPVDDLFGILALESKRQRCTVIGEDLGTLPEGFQQRMRAADLLSYRLLFFEKDERQEFRPPRQYPPAALVAVGTHDLATLPGFWRGRDLEVRRELGLYPSREMATRATEYREQERAALVRAFKREGLLPESFPETGSQFSLDIVQAAYRFLARSPARLLLVHLEDVLGEENQINLPGTVAEHPNWRRKMLIELEALERDPRVLALAMAIREERKKGAGAPKPRRAPPA